MKPFARTLAVAALLAGTTHTHAELLGWLDFGPAIPGESTDPRHKNWCDVTSFDVARDDKGTTLTCRRRIDKASPLLMQACCDPSALTEVKLDVARVGPEGTMEFWQLVFHGVGLDEYKQVPAGNDPQPTEAISIHWTSLVSIYHIFPPGQASYPITTIISADGDGDGLPDAYEEDVGLDPSVSNAGKDTDGDGLADTDEYRLGTHPNDPTSFFKAVARMDGPDSMELTWPSKAGEAYRIDFSPNLLTPFSEMETVTATSAETHHSVTRMPPSGFFRVRKDLP